MSTELLSWQRNGQVVIAKRDYRRVIRGMELVPKEPYPKKGDRLTISKVGQCICGNTVNLSFAEIRSDLDKLPCAAFSADFFAPVTNGLQKREKSKQSPFLDAMKELLTTSAPIIEDDEDDEAPAPKKEKVKEYDPV